METKIQWCQLRAPTIACFVSKVHKSRVRSTVATLPFAHVSTTYAEFVSTHRHLDALFRLTLNASGLELATVASDLLSSLIYNNHMNV